MKYLNLQTKDPYYNLALEEYLFMNASDDIFMLWQNEPTVVIGKNQNAYAEVNREYTDSHGIHIARRITGGGAVYHDLGNLNYTFISVGNSEHTLDFAGFTAPIIDALASLGLSAKLSGRNDLEYEGRKFSGNAQYSHVGRVLHHGTLLFDSDLDVLSSVLLVDEEKIRAKSIRSTRSRVANLKPLLKGVGSVREFAERILDFVRERYAAEELALPEEGKIDELTRRNSSHGWLYPDRGIAAEYERTVKKRFSFGTVEVHIGMSGERIKDVRILGDFFGTKDVAELEKYITGATISELYLILTDVDVGSFIYGMTCDELIELIK